MAVCAVEIRLWLLAYLVITISCAADNFQARSSCVLDENWKCSVVPLGICPVFDRTEYEYRPGPGWLNINITRSRNTTTYRGQKYIEPQVTVLWKVRGSDLIRHPRYLVEVSSMDSLYPPRCFELSTTPTTDRMVASQLVTLAFDRVQHFYADVTGKRAAMFRVSTSPMTSQPHNRWHSHVMVQAPKYGFREDDDDKAKWAAMLYVYNTSQPTRSVTLYMAKDKRHLYQSFEVVLVNSKDKAVRSIKKVLNKLNENNNSFLFGNLNASTYTLEVRPIGPYCRKYAIDGLCRWMTTSPFQLHGYVEPEVKLSQRQPWLVVKVGAIIVALLWILIGVYYVRRCIKMRNEKNSNKAPPRIQVLLVYQAEDRCLVNLVNYISQRCTLDGYCDVTIKAIEQCSKKLKLKTKTVKYVLVVGSAHLFSNVKGKDRRGQVLFLTLEHNEKVDSELQYVIPINLTSLLYKIHCHTRYKDQFDQKMLSLKQATNTDTTDSYSGDKIDSGVEADRLISRSTEFIPPAGMSSVASLPCIYDDRELEVSNRLQNPDYDFIAPGSFAADSFYEIDEFEGPDEYDSDDNTTQVVQLKLLKEMHNAVRTDNGFC